MMPDSNWRGVLFDLDGTLADTVDLILTSYRHTMVAHLGEAPPDGRFLATIGTPLPIQLGDFARTEVERLAMLETYVAFQLGLHDGMVRPFPGAVAVLTELRAAGIPVGIVTSKGHRIGQRTLEVCALDACIDYVVFGDQVTRGKPDPEPVRRAMADMGIDHDPGRVVFIGDSPHDLRAGRLAGTQTAAVSWGPVDRRVLEAEAPDFFLERMEDVLGLAPTGARFRTT